MDIQKTDESGVTVLTLEGCIDFAVRKDLFDAVQAVSLDAPAKILLLFHNVDIVHTTGLGVLVSLFKEVTSKNGQMKFGCMKPEVYDLFQVTRLVKIFEIYETKEEALKSFS